MEGKFDVKFNLTIFMAIEKLISVNSNFSPEKLSVKLKSVTFLVGGYFVKCYTHNYFQPYSMHTRTLGFKIMLEG